MAYDLSTISSERVIRPPRIVILGPHKIGKSEWAAGAESPFFFPVKGEEGLDDIKVPKAPVCTSMEDIFGWLGALYEDDHQHQTNVIDSGSTLELLIHEDVCNRLGGKNIIKAGGGYGAGYKEALNTWRKITQWLDALRSHKNMASIIIGHVKVGRCDDPEGGSYNQYQWDVHDQAANLFYRWSDCILFANKKVSITKEDVGYGTKKGRGTEIVPDKRFLYTKQTPAHPGGGRGPYGRLPDELSLGDGLTPGAGWKHFRDAVSTAMQVNQISPQSEEITNE